MVAAPKDRASANEEVILEVSNLKMHFPVTEGIIFQRVTGLIKAVDDISFSVRRGETMGLVGESGCGKTTTGRCILQLTRPTSGRIKFEGANLVELKSKDLREMRKKLAPIITQEATTLLEQ